MNVKISIELSEQQLEFAERLVSQGAYASISDLVQEQIRDLMFSGDSLEGGPDPVDGMADEIRRRATLPDDQWLSPEEFWTEVEKRSSLRRPSR